MASGAQPPQLHRVGYQDFTCTRGKANRLGIAREIGARHLEGVWLGELGRAYLDGGNRGAGCRYLQEALAVLDPLGVPEAAEVRQHLA